jgi:hypothetical protein
VKINEIEIHSGDIDRPYTDVGPITARCSAATAFSNPDSACVQTVGGDAAELS